MLNIRKITLLFFLLMNFLPSLTNATHVAGAEMTFICVGSNGYRINYTLFRDCDGILPEDSIELIISNDCGLSIQNYQLILTQPPVEIPLICSNSTSRCAGGFYKGIEKYTYSAIITLTGPCLWEVGRLEESRISNYTTVNPLSLPSQYTYCRINNISGLCNTSPVFFESPMFNYIANQILEVNTNFITNNYDNDSIVYELIAPRTGPNLTDTIIYLNPYSSQQPLNFNPSATFDYETGILRGLTTGTDVTVYALLVSEFRNGILIGQIERDIALYLSNNSGQGYYPILAWINDSISNCLDVYANQANCFYIRSVVVDTVNISRMEFDNSIPGMNFYTSGGRVDTGFFCWTPGLSDTINNPHYFKISVKDDNCPYFRKTTKEYCLNVLNVVGINEIDESSFMTWPNPVISEFNILMDDNENQIENSEISIYNLQKRLVFKTVFSKNHEILNLSDLSAGLYILFISNEKNNLISHKKIVKL